jgi:hypothetical protein
MLTLFNKCFNNCTAELSGASSNSDNSHGLRVLFFCFFF